MAGLQLAEDEEYSEAGRAVYPAGLYRLLRAFHGRYRRYSGLKYIVTENGMADESDALRRPYLLEHLLALRGAIQDVKLAQNSCLWGLGARVEGSGFRTWG